MRARLRSAPVLVLWSSLLATTLASGCAAPVDLKSGLRVAIVKTGWFDAGLTQDGKNKLVPTVSFRLTNLSNQSLAVLQVNALFRRVNDPGGEWGSGFMTVAGSWAMTGSPSRPPRSFSCSIAAARKVSPATRRMLRAPRRVMKW